MMDGTLASQVMMSVIARKRKESERERTKRLGGRGRKVKSDRFLPLKVKASEFKVRSVQFNWTGEAIVAGITNQVSGSLKNVKDADERKGREHLPERRRRKKSQCKQRR